MDLQYSWLIPINPVQFSFHQNIATYYGAFVKKSDYGQEDQLWVSMKYIIFIFTRMFSALNI